MEIISKTNEGLWIECGYQHIGLGRNERRDNVTGAIRIPKDPGMIRNSLIFGSNNDNGNKIYRPAREVHLNEGPKRFLEPPKPGGHNRYIKKEPITFEDQRKYSETS